MPPPINDGLPKGPARATCCLDCINAFTVKLALRILSVLTMTLITGYSQPTPAKGAENVQAKKLYERGLELLDQGLCDDDKFRIGIGKYDLRVAFEHTDSQPEFKPKPIAQEGLKHIIEAYNLGSLDAGVIYAQCMENGVILPEDYPDAMDLFGKLAAAGNAASQYHLAQELMNGRLAKDRFILKRTGTSIPTDVEAFSLFLKAAESGHALAQNSVAVCYQRGVGTERDPQASFKWAKLSAYAGHEGGQVTLGIHYINGDAGAERDYDTAYAWFKIASDRTDLTTIYSKRIEPWVDRKKSAEIEARLRKELATSGPTSKR